MNCEAFARWLDDGAPAEGEAAFAAHAGACRSCAAELAAARSLERLLASPPAPAPAGFPERVMARVMAPVVRPELVAPSLPWWARLPAQPATALALAVASLTLWRADAILNAGAGLARALARPPVPAAPGWLDSLAPADPLITAGMAAALLPLLAWGSWLLFVWSARAASVRPRAGAHSH